jgi:hypothetical protein
MNISCHFDSSFYIAFRNNMQALGLPVPKSWFSSIGTAIATIKAINHAIKINGPEMPISYIVRGIPALASSIAVSELLAPIEAVTASFYLGACIGSLGVATHKTLNCNFTNTFDFKKAWNLISDSGQVPSYLLQYSSLRSAPISRKEHAKIKNTSGGIQLGTDSQLSTFNLA